MKSREEYVKICQTCTKRQQSMKLGIVCSLTGQHADYHQIDCPEFQRDEHATKIQAQAENEAKLEISFNFYGSLVMVIVSVLWIFIGLAFERLFLMPIFGLIGGIILMVRYSKREKIPKSKNSDNLIDDDF